MSDKIFKEQRKYFNKLFSRDDLDPTRLFIFTPGSNDLRKLTGRKRGRPRLHWATEVTKKNQ